MADAFESLGFVAEPAAKDPFAALGFQPEAGRKQQTPAQASTPKQSGMWDSIKSALTQHAAESLGGITASQAYDMFTDSIGKVASVVTSQPQEKLAADFPLVSEVARRIGRTVPELIDFVMTPAGAAAAAVPASPVLAPVRQFAVPAVGAGFSTEMATHAVPEAFKGFVEDPGLGTATDLVKAGAMTAAPFLHAAAQGRDAARMNRATQALSEQARQFETNLPEDVRAARMEPTQLLAEEPTRIINREIERRQRGGTQVPAEGPLVEQKWQEPAPAQPLMNRAQRRATINIPEEGLSTEIQQAIGERDRVAQQVTGKPFAELSNTERIVVDDMIAEQRGAQPSAQGWLDRLDTTGREATERLRERGVTAGSTVGMNQLLDPANVRDFALSIAGDVARGVLKFEQFVSRLVADYGPKARLAAQRIWTEAQRLAADETGELRIGTDASQPPGKRTAIGVDEPAQQPGLTASSSYDQTRAKILDKVDVSSETRERIAAVMDQWERANPQRQVVSFEDVRKEARELDPRILLDLKKPEPGTTLNPAVRFAAREHWNALVDEIQTRRKELQSKAGSMDTASVLDQEGRIARLEQDAQRLADVLIPTRSQDGRNLAYHRMVAGKAGFDQEYWVARAKRSMGLTPETNMPADVFGEVNEILSRGRTAERQAVERAEAIPAPETPSPVPQPRIPRRNRSRATVGEEAVPQPQPIPAAKAAAAPRRLTAAERQAVVDADPAVKQARQDLARKMRDLDKTGWLETITTLRKAGLLTGVKTHLRNLGGNAAFQVMEEVSRLPGVVVDAAISLRTGRRTVEGPNPASVVRAAREAATRGIREAGEILRRGATDTDLAKVDMPKELNSGNRFLDGYARAVFRTLAAEDRVFKVYAYERSLREQMRLARVSATTPAMQVQALADADFATFNNSNLIGEFVRSGKAKLRTKGLKGRTAAAAIDLVVPFTQTPANVLARTLEYAGGGLPAGAARLLATRMQNKALGPELQRSISMQMGRGIVGLPLVLLGWKLAEAGLMTGTRQEEAGLRNIEEAAGRLPGAILVNGEWRQVSPFSPGGAVLTIGATLQRESTERMRDELKRPDKLAAVGAKAVMEHPFLQGIDQAISAMQNPGRRLESYIASTAGSFVPTIVNDVGTATDGQRRDARRDSLPESVGAAVASRVPGVRTALPVRRDVFGKAGQENRAAAVDPTIGSRNKPDSFAQELLRIGVGISDPQRKPGESIADWTLRRTLVGGLIQEELRNVIATPKYQGLADREAKALVIRKAITRAREKAKREWDRWAEEFPDIEMRRQNIRQALGR